MIVLINNDSHNLRNICVPGKPLERNQIKRQISVPVALRDSHNTHAHHGKEALFRLNCHFWLVWTRFHQRGSKITIFWLTVAPYTYREVSGSSIPRKHFCLGTPKAGPKLCFQSSTHTKATVLLPLALTPTMAHFLPKMLVNFYLLLLGRGTTLPFWCNTISMQTSQKYWSRTTFWDLGFHLFGEIEVYFSGNLVFPRFHRGN